MFKIEKAIFDQLDFDFEAALEQFKAEKALHPFTVDVPSPTAHGFVEAAFHAGGYEIVEPEAEEPMAPEASRSQSIQPDPRKAAALERAQKLKGKTSDSQLAEIRSLLTEILEMLPG